MRSRSLAGEAPNHAPVALGGPAMRVIAGMRLGGRMAIICSAPHPALALSAYQQRRPAAGPRLSATRALPPASAAPPKRTSISSPA